MRLRYVVVLAGMPVVLNQLLSDRRPAAQALLRDLLLNADGSLRSDATTQQILQARLAACSCSQSASPPHRLLFKQSHLLDC